MKIKWFAVILLGAVMMTFGITASHADGPTITFASQFTRSDPDRAKNVDKMEQYAKQVAGKYTLKLEAVQSDDLKSLLRIDLAAGNLPDLFWFWAPATDSGTFVKNDLIIKADDFFAVTKKVARKDFFPYCFERLAINGVNYAVPMDENVGAWLANKDLFQKYNLKFPKTYNDIIELAKTFSANGIITMATGSKGGNPGHWLIDQMYTQLRGASEELHAMPTTWNLRSNLFKKTLDLFVKMRDARCFPSDMTTNGDWGPSFALYNQGRAALIPAWGWQVSAMTPEAYAWTKVIDAPVITDLGPTVDTSKLGMLMGTAGLEFSKKSWNDPQKQSAIVDFANFLLSDEMYQLRYDVAGTLPPKIIPNFDYNTHALPIVRDMIAWNRGKVSWPMHMVLMPSDVAWQQYEAFMDGFFAGTLTPDQYIDKIQESMDKQHTRS